MLLVFASRNGAGKFLSATIASLRALKPPASGLKIIAVDSASTDGTGDMLRAASDLPMTVIRVDEPGKNRALNAALDMANEALTEHSLVVFTDDDVVADPGWLDALDKAAAQRTDFDIFGGAVEPVFPHQPDAELEALEDRFDVLFARVSRPEGPCAATSVFGPNMAIRARCFRDGVRFNAGIGPDGRSLYPMGSESELLGRLERAGAKTWHVADAKVKHLISAGAMTAASALERARRHGAGYVQMLQTAASKRTVFGVPAWIWRGYLTQAVLLALSAPLPARAKLRTRFEYAWFGGAVSHLMSGASSARAEGLQKSP